MKLRGWHLAPVFCSHDYDPAKKRIYIHGREGKRRLEIQCRKCRHWAPEAVLRKQGGKHGNAA
jgi:hypothetical protein